MSKGHDLPDFQSDGHVTLEMMIPGNKAGIVIGKGGETIKLLQVTLVSLLFLFLQRQTSITERLRVYYVLQFRPKSCSQRRKQHPMEWRVQFKPATLTFKALHTGRPPYLSDLLQYHKPTRSLRSSSTHQLSIFHHNIWISCFSVFCPKSLEFITCQYP